MQQENSIFKCKQFFFYSFHSNLWRAINIDDRWKIHQMMKKLYHFQDFAFVFAIDSNRDKNFIAEVYSDNKRKKNCREIFLYIFKCSLLWNRNIQMKLLVTSNWTLTHFYFEWFKVKSLKFHVSLKLQRIFFHW